MHIGGLILQHIAITHRSANDQPLVLGQFHNAAGDFRRGFFARSIADNLDAQ